jgi:uncharacterized phiE125 gp8 family phage protein
MALVLTDAPETEPVTLADAKAHLRIDADDEDALIAQLITAARMFIERMLGQALVTQSWSYFLDYWPRGGCIALPLAPVQAVDAVKVHDAAGGAVTLETSAYAVDTLSVPARLVLRGATPSSTTRELNAFEVAFTAGYGDEAEDVPAPIAQALLLLVAHWFERREPVVLDGAPQEVPGTVAGLLLPYRRVRL